jgi:hypothetical protein
MVVKRILPIFILIFLAFSTPVYGLRPLSRDEAYIAEADTSEGEELSSTIFEDEIEDIRKEKMNLMEEISSSREERNKSLHPFVYSETTFDTESAPAKPVMKSPVTVRASYYDSKQKSSGQGTGSRLLANLIFFFVIIAAFLASYFFIRPKSK